MDLNQWIIAYDGCKRMGFAEDAARCAQIIGIITTDYLKEYTKKIKEKTE